jgi:Lung seven transmembrane receptor
MSNQYGQMLHSTNEKSVVSGYLSLNSSTENRTIVYPIEETGFYCFLIENLNENTVPIGYEVYFNNPFGALPAIKYRTMIFHFTLFIIYIVFCLLWAYITWKYWSEILAFQNYVAILLFNCFVESYIIYMFYSFFENGQSHSWLSQLAIFMFSALKSSLTLNLILIVSTGYGIIK